MPGQRPPTVDLRTERLHRRPAAFSWWKFRPQGRSGIEVSEQLLPKLGESIDDICVIRSMYTFNPTHTPARNLIHSGNISATRPTLGAWISYGLGTENQNLPGFVALSPSSRGESLWRSGFLPSEHPGHSYQPVRRGPGKNDSLFAGIKQLDAKDQRLQLDLIQDLNRDHMSSFGADAFLEGRIQAMETAYRMQFAALDTFDVRKEPAAMREEYGTTPYGNGCLLARRLVEKGVRYVQVVLRTGPALGRSRLTGLSITTSAIAVRTWIAPRPLCCET